MKPTDEEKLEKIFSEAKPALENLLGKLKPNIESHRWNALLIDDVAARLPGRVLHRIIENWNQDHGFESPKVYFFAGGSPREKFLPHSTDLPDVPLREGELQRYIGSLEHLATSRWGEPEAGVAYVGNIYVRGRKIEDYFGTPEIAIWMDISKSEPPTISISLEDKEGRGTLEIILWGEDNTKAGLRLRYAEPSPETSRWAQDLQKPSPEEYKQFIEKVIDAAKITPGYTPELSENSLAVEEGYKKLREYTRSIKRDVGGGRVLVFTEIVYDGITIDHIARILKEGGVNFDVATLAERYPDMPGHLIGELDAETYRDVMAFKTDPEFYGDPWQEGKEYGGVMKDHTGPTTKADLTANRKLVNLSREMANRLGDELYRKHFKTQNPP